MNVSIRINMHEFKSIKQTSFRFLIALAFLNDIVF